MMAVRRLKKGDFFTRKSISAPKDCQVWIRGEYCPGMKKYECVRFSDANSFCYLPGDHPVFVDFCF